ncbi:MAG TPA: radical SAM protein [bacterium]|nr:radical SAM protein [bacterium]
MIRPQNAFIVLNTDCDKRDECSYCFYNTQPERAVQSKLDTEKIVSILRRLMLLNVGNVYLTGGEPLLRDDLERIVSAATAMRLNTYLLSNGRLLDSSRVARLDRAGLDVFVLSLNDLSLEDKKTISLAARFKNAALSFIFVLTSKNTALVRHVTELARALDAGLVFQPAWIPAENPLRATISPASLSQFEWSELYSELRPWAVQLGYEDYLELTHDIYRDGKLKPKRCGMGTDSFVIDADGAVYPCFHRRDLPCGNVRRDDIAEVLDRVSKHSAELSTAPCFGEHCVSLHTSFKK